MVEQYYLSDNNDNSTNILYQSPSDVKWIFYNRHHGENYDKPGKAYQEVTKVVVVRVNKQEITFT
jgi:hypothetical protein